MLLIAGTTGVLSLWDEDTRVQIGENWTGHQKNINCFKYSPDCKYVASGSEDKSLRVWDAKEGTEIASHRTGKSSQIHCLSYSPDGKQIFVARDDRTVSVHCSSTCDQIGMPWLGHTGPVYTVACSPFGDIVVSGGSDFSLRIWDAESGKTRGAWEGHTGAIRIAEFSPCGNVIATGGYDRMIRLWDVRTAKQIENVWAPLKGHTAAVRTLAFSPCGTKLSSGGADTTVRVWELGSGKQIGGGSWRAHAYSVYGVCFDNTGKFLASASYDKTVKIWDLSTARLVGDPIVPGFQVSCVSFVPMQGGSSQRARAAGPQSIALESSELTAAGNESSDPGPANVKTAEEIRLSQAYLHWRILADFLIGTQQKPRGTGGRSRRAAEALTFLDGDGGPGYWERDQRGNRIWVSFGKEKAKDATQRSEENTQNKKLKGDVSEPFDEETSPADSSRPTQGNDKCFVVGQKVLGLYDNGDWYEAEIENMVDGKIILRWDDGDTFDTVKNPEDVRPRDENSHSKQLSARAVEEQEKDADMGATRVTRRRSKLKAQLGNKEDEAGPPDKQRELDLSPFSIGMKVMGLYKNGDWYEAEIKGKVGDKFELIWADGDRSDTYKSLREIRIPNKEDLEEMESGRQEKKSERGGKEAMKDKETEGEEEDEKDEEKEDEEEQKEKRAKVQRIDDKEEGGGKRIRLAEDKGYEHSSSSEEQVLRASKGHGEEKANLPRTSQIPRKKRTGKSCIITKPR